MISSLPSIKLESGAILDDLQVAYQTWGTLNDAKDNAILVCHGLTGNEDVNEWWGKLFGESKTFDPNEHFVIGTNCLGSCYGTTGPTSRNPESGEAYQADFPRFTIRDAVAAQRALIEGLGIQKLQMVIGPSMGGMQTLEWCLSDFPIESAVVIGCGPSHSAWAVGISHTQREAIFSDPKWQDGFYGDDPPAKGLSIARQIAMLAYRSQPSFIDRFGREEGNGFEYSVESYLSYQGDKLVQRFDVNSYVRLTQMMDSHDVGRDRGGIKKALQSIQIPVLILGINSDVLYPTNEQRELAQLIPNASLGIVDADQGHDAFLIELDQINTLICNWRLKNQAPHLSSVTI